MTTIDEAEIRRLKDAATRDVRDVVEDLERGFPGISEGIATILGCGLGGAGSLATLSAIGYAGLSAAGITSGLATAGALVGGGMVAGIGVLAAPIAILGIAGYALAKKHRNAKLAIALATAIEKLYSIQRRLQQNAEYFKEELAGIKITIDMLTSKKPK